jgi:PcfJ-like protein
LFDTGLLPVTEGIDYAPLPVRWEHEGFSFVALQTGKALHSEGRAMHHCVKTYWGHVISGRSRIYSILEEGNRVATLELSCQHSDYKCPSTSTAEKSSRYQVRQLAGPCNARPAVEVTKAVGRFVEEINNRVLVA